MKGKASGLLFLVICAALAVLLLAATITPLVGGCVFAVALIGLGAMSRSFTKS
jgi:hypothetical protein